MQKITAKISLNSIKRNALAFKQATGKPVWAVVKADAYGHGGVEVTDALSGVADGFAVALLSEAVEISTAACGKDILIFAPPLCEEEALTAAEHGFILSVTDYGAARLVDRVAKTHKIPVRVHLKTNTGMNRYGMTVQSLGKACKLLKANPFVCVEGMYSHLYGNTLSQAETQRERFLRMQAVCRRYFPCLRYHLSATFGALLGERFVFDFTRIGLGLYGYLPSQDTPKKLTLERAMSVYAPVTATRKYAFGGAGYGKDLTAYSGELSVLRLGYADGVLRNPCNGMAGANANANCLCMDACVRKGKIKKGKLVPVLTDADETARLCGTVSYEVLCAISRRARRIYERE